MQEPTVGCAVYDDRQLVDLCASGDEAAWEYFVQKYGGLVYHIVYGFVSNQQEVKELFIHCIGELWRNGDRRLRSWEGESKLSSYLAAVISHLCGDFVRSRFHREGRSYTSLEGHIPAGIQPRYHKESRHADVVRDIVGGLTEDDQMLLSLFYWQELDYREIAAIMGMSVGAVGKRLFKVRKKLRNILKDKGIKNLSDTW